MTILETWEFPLVVSSFLPVKAYWSQALPQDSGELTLPFTSMEDEGYKWELYQFPRDEDL